MAALFGGFGRDRLQSMKSDPSLAPEHIVETACPLDCPDGCSLNVTVQDGRITKINKSITDGYICAKVRRFGERLYGADRLLYPAVRKGPKGAGASSAYRGTRR